MICLLAIFRDHVTSLRQTSHFDAIGFRLLVLSRQAVEMFIKRLGEDNDFVLIDQHSRTLIYLLQHSINRCNVTRALHKRTACCLPLRSRYIRAGMQYSLCHSQHSKLANNLTKGQLCWFGVIRNVNGGCRLCEEERRRPYAPGCSIFESRCNID